MLLVAQIVYSNMYVMLSGGYGDTSNLNQMSSKDLSVDANMSIFGSKVYKIHVVGMKISSTAKDNSYPYAATIGYRCKNGLRFALEGAMRHHDLDVKLSGTQKVSYEDFTTSGTVSTEPSPIKIKVSDKSSHFRLVTILAKIYYDHALTKEMAAYAGFALGAGFVEFKQGTVAVDPFTIKVVGGIKAPGLSIGAGSLSSDVQDVVVNSKASTVSTTTGVGQLIFGLSYRVMKNMSVCMEYQYTHTMKIKENIDSTYANHDGLLGIAYHLA